MINRKFEKAKNRLCFITGNVRQRSVVVYGNYYSDRHCGYKKLKMKREIGSIYCFNGIGIF